MMPMSLQGVRVLDLTRILAGPSATQLLGDLGADVVKVEKPEEGDDTRTWGPPFVPGRDGQPTSESAYYLCANRNKRSIEIDLASTEGQALVLRLLAHADVLIENYKVGGLAAYGLSYAQLKDQFPRLIYCSITGFGQTGPYASRAGYDFLIQGMGGIMSLTGTPDGEPMRIGVALADVMAGMYASVGILAALRHRDQTGQGQYIDISLLDTQVALLINTATNFFTTQKDPQRWGNGHPNIVPYQVFPTADDPIIVAVGNDSQFRKLCETIGRPEMASNLNYATNAGRVQHRQQVVAALEAALRTEGRHHWVAALGAVGVPCGPVNTLSQVFEDPQVKHREMVVAMPHAQAADGFVNVLANPIRFSETPVQYRITPPIRNEHAQEILHDWLGEKS